MRDFDKFIKNIEQHLLFEEFIDKDEIMNYIRRFIDYQLMINVIDEEGLFENQQIVDLINDEDWDKDPTNYFNSLKKSKIIGYLTNYQVEDLSKMKLFKVKGFDVGYAIENDGNIVSMYNNTGFKNLGTFLIKSSIKNGGNKLDHFDGFLTGFYSRFGFIEDKTKREGWNDDLASIYWKYEKVNIFDPNFSVYANEINDNNVYLYRNEIKRYSEGKPDVIFRNII